MQSLELFSLLQNQQAFFQNSSELILRNLCFSTNERKITFISGPAHSGKTSFLKQIADSLKGIKIYINFGDMQFHLLDFGNLQPFEEALCRICQKTEKTDSEPVYYFLDEIQNLPGWEAWVEMLCKEAEGVFITFTASSPKMLEILSKFNGKCEILNVLPFSFKECLLIKSGRVPNPELLTPSRRDDILCMFLQYFENGGYPELIKKGKIDICDGYFEEILQKTATRINVEEPDILRKLAIFLISNMASEYSIETLKKVSTIDDGKMIQNVLDCLEEQFLLYRVPKIPQLFEDEDGMDNSSKIYIGDTGFFKAVYPNYPDSLGLRFENLIFLELLRRGKEIFYFKGKRECDFLIKDKDSNKVLSAIQTSLYFGSPAAKERELLGLVEAMEAYGLDEGLILTMDDEEILGIESKAWKKKIIIKPAWKWMLE